MEEEPFHFRPLRPRAMKAAGGNRAEFLAVVRRALGHESKRTPKQPSQDGVEERARAARELASERGAELLSQFERTASEAGWLVFRARSPQEAAGYAAKVAGDLAAKLVVTARQPALREIGVEAAVAGSGAECLAMAVDPAADSEEAERQRRRFRQRALEADLGVAAADYAVAETGSCVLLPRPGLSRLVSLLPPAFLTFVRKGSVLPSLDELFAVLHPGQGEGALNSYASIVSGPSRTADIEQTLILGVHGPGEVHAVLLDYDG